MLIMGFFTFISLVGMIASGEQTKGVRDNSVLVLNMTGTMEERAEEDLLSQLRGNVTQQLGLDDILSAISKAKDNERIKGIYIEAGAFIPDSYASLQAIRKALADFKKSGKWVVAYGDAYTQGLYYLSSVADKVWVNPQGIIDWHGIGAQKVYFKDLMEKVGVKMQVAKVGSYKSAVEIFTADKMSDADREQTEAYINGIWKNVTKDVAASRHLSEATLNAYADSLVTFADTKELVKLKLADALLYTDQVKGEIKKMLKMEPDDDIHQLTIDDMKRVKSKEKEGEQIAVYYAFGSIVDNAVGGMSSQGHQIVGTEVCQDLEKLMNDDDVKAVVFRINSGGGSAYASEQMWHQIMELKKKKPIVVSMGGMAASGGYYISAPANWIVAEPTTLTGSIGIFGMFPDPSELLTQKLGLKFDYAATNKYSTFGANGRPISADEMSHIEAYVDRGYKLFRQRVAEGRKMTTDQVEQIAQGHVWLGQDALRIKLVDQLGGLNEAVAKAAQLAKLTEYHCESYPAPKGFMEQLLDKGSAGSYLDEQLQLTLGEYYQPFMFMKNIQKQNPIQARIPYYIYIR
jgi:protease-4